MTHKFSPASLVTPQVSVVIPVRRINRYIQESIPLILNHPYVNLGVIVLPDISTTGDGVESSDRVRIIPTGSMGPAQKRDLGATLASGTILAFLDDDAYPAPTWLSAAIPHFRDESTAAVGGPTLTPSSDSLWQQVSGWALSTQLGSGGAVMRYAPRGKAHDVDDWPSVNLLVRKADFQAVGGFNCAYYPGEDTKLCLDLTKKLGKRIVYEPAALVYHHRRSLFWGHFRQIGQYAVHRGFFVKAFPETSRRLSYFLPSMLALGLIGGLPAALLSARLRAIYLAIIASYTGALLLTGVSVGIRARRPLMGAFVAPAIAMTHIWYGLSFLRGLCVRELAS